MESIFLYIKIDPEQGASCRPTGNEPRGQTCNRADWLELGSYTLAPSLKISVKRAQLGVQTHNSSAWNLKIWNSNCLLLEFSLLSSAGTARVYLSPAVQPRRKRGSSHSGGTSQQTHTSHTDCAHEVGQAPEGETVQSERFVSLTGQQDEQLWPETAQRQCFRTLTIWGELIHSTNMRGLYQH